MDAADCFARFNQRFQTAQGQRKAAAAAGAAEASSDGGRAEGGVGGSTLAKFALPKTASHQPQKSQQQNSSKQARANRKEFKENAAAHNRKEAPTGIADALGAYAAGGRGKGARSTALTSALSLMQGISSKRRAPPGTGQEVEPAPHRLAASSRAVGAAAGKIGSEAGQAPAPKVARSSGGQQPGPASQGVTARLIHVRERLEQQYAGSYCEEPKSEAQQAVSASRSSGSPVAAACPKAAAAQSSRPPWHTGMQHDEYFAAARQHLWRIAEAANSIRPNALGSQQLVHLLSAKLEGVVDGSLDAAREQQQHHHHHHHPQQQEQASVPQALQPARRGSTHQGSSGALRVANQLPSTSLKGGTQLPAAARGLGGSWRSRQHPSQQSKDSFGLQPTAARQSPVLTQAGCPVEEPAASAGEVLGGRSRNWGSFLDADDSLPLPAQKRSKFLPADLAAGGDTGLLWDGDNGGVTSDFGALDDLDHDIFQGREQLSPVQMDPLAGFSISPSFDRQRQQQQQQSYSRPITGALYAEPGHSFLGHAGLKDEWVPPWLSGTGLGAMAPAAAEGRDVHSGRRAIQHGCSHGSWLQTDRDSSELPVSEAGLQGWQLGSREGAGLGSPQLRGSFSQLGKFDPLSWLKDA